MDHPTLKKLDKLLNLLEAIAVLLKSEDEQHIDIQHLDKGIMQAIGILDEIVPRPLPPEDSKTSAPKNAVTVWKRWDKEDQCWKHNHIQFGWAIGRASPRPESEKQKEVWPNQRWKKEYRHLTPEKTVTDDE